MGKSCSPGAPECRKAVLWQGGSPSSSVLALSRCAGAALSASAAVQLLWLLAALYLCPPGLRLSLVPVSADWTCQAQAGTWGSCWGWQLDSRIPMGPSHLSISVLTASCKVCCQLGFPLLCHILLHCSRAPMLKMTQNHVLQSLGCP